ncbi:MAG TPA: iron-containing alcohol dehydrogenase, partial [Bacteroidales bacterium]|nr:iron-containing alcohol dehydrogenase [Bacteroidales bacterium]
MIKSFTFSGTPHIIFGPGTLTELPGIITGFGRNILLITGRSSFLSTDRASGLLNDFDNESIRYKTISVHGEPSPAFIDEIVSEHSTLKIDLVVSVGGGSVIDAGKAISAMLYRKESVLEYLEGIGKSEHPGTKIPFIAIPTTSGTGSEATKNAVLSDVRPGGYKRSLRHNHFLPDIALVDPELTINCTPIVTAASGMDCFTQLTEAWLSPTASKYTDALAIEGLRAVKNSLVKAFEDGENIEARTHMSFAALTSGICLANAGLGVVHGFASAIGGLYDLPHGMICGSLMASANEITVRKLRKTGVNAGALEKYATLGRIFIDNENKSDDFYVDAFINYLHELTLSLKISRLDIPGNEEAVEQVCMNT